MKKHLLRIIKAVSVVLGCAIIFILIPAKPVEAATSSSINSLQDKIAQNESQQNEYKDKISTLSDSADAVMQKKSYYDKQVQLTKDKISLTEELISQYEALISQKENEINGKETEIDGKFDEFLQRLSVNYEDGFVNYLILIFEANSFTDFLMNTERTADILEYDRTLMNNLEAEKTDLETTKKQLEDAKKSQEDARASLESTKSELEGQVSTQESYLSSIQEDQSKYESLLEEAQAADAALNEELEKALAEAAKNETVQYAVQGALIWPVSTQYSTVSSGFGWRDLYGKQDFHYGIDIPAPYGSNVYASQSGTVTYAGYHYSYGNFIVIDHGGGYATLYAHNSSLNVSVGQTVKQGDVIAFVGATGNAYGNHCHFEVRYNGKVQNPLGYVTQP